MEHEAQAFRDWENWVVLHTPNAPKRRRLTFTLQSKMGDRAGAVDNLPPSTSLWLPVGSPNFALSIQMEQVQGEPPLPGASTEEGPSIHSATYDRAYAAWKKGTISDSVVELLFGGEWLFLFQLSHRGTVADTLAPIMLDEEVPNGQSGEEASSGAAASRALTLVAATQPDGLETQHGGNGQWSQSFQGHGGLILDVGDSSLEGAVADAEEGALTTSAGLATNADDLGKTGADEKGEVKTGRMQH